MHCQWLGGTIPRSGDVSKLVDPFLRKGLVRRNHYTGISASQQGANRAKSYGVLYGTLVISPIALDSHRMSTTLAGVCALLKIHSELKGEWSYLTEYACHRVPCYDVFFWWHFKAHGSI